jgi:hypothetical protein
LNKERLDLLKDIFHKRVFHDKTWKIGTKMPAKAKTGHLMTSWKGLVSLMADPKHQGNGRHSATRKDKKDL